MIKLSKDEFLDKKEFYISEMKAGKIFIYPTDTIYGIGCYALNDESVSKIRKIKKRPNDRFSVLVPSIDWVFEECLLNDAKKHLVFVKLPGRYTLVCNLRDRKCIAKGLNSSENALAVRIPDMWFSDIITEFDGAFVTTSVNISGEKSALKIDDISQEILDQVDYVIEDDSCISGRASMVIDLRGDEPIILRK